MSDAYECDSWNAVLGSCFPGQLGRGLIRDINRKGEEADSNNSETHSLVSLSALNVSINRQPPKQCRTQRNPNEAVHSETHKGDAPCNRSCRDGDEAFEGVPSNREIL